MLAFDKPYEAISCHHKSTENAKTRLSIRLDRCICWNVIQKKTSNHNNMSTLHRCLQSHIVSHDCIETFWLYCMIKFNINLLSTLLFHFYIATNILHFCNSFWSLWSALFTSTLDLQLANLLSNSHFRFATRTTTC